MREAPRVGDLSGLELMNVSCETLFVPAFDVVDREENAGFEASLMFAFVCGYLFAELDDAFGVFAAAIFVAL